MLYRGTTWWVIQISALGFDFGARIRQLRQQNGWSRQ